jgi:precorrin-6A synthase
MTAQDATTAAGRFVMRRLLLIGIGPGDPEHITIQAIRALNKVDVFFALDKGAEKDDLAALRRAICEAHIRGRTYRMVAAPDPPRDRAPASYRQAVEDWHESRAALLETMIVKELGEDECGAFLVWGEPALYDSTLRIVEQILAKGAVAFTYEIIPGISSVQALAAAHKIALNRIGEAIHITTGRNLAAGVADGFDNVVVMLDGQCAFNAIKDADVDIYWGAYLGTKDEILIAGELAKVAGEIERIRSEARTRKGWIMDTYLLRRRRPS